jgi:hypothetical protein
VLPLPSLSVLILALAVPVFAGSLFTEVLQTLGAPPRAGVPTAHTNALTEDLMALHARELDAAGREVPAKLPWKERHRRLHERMARKNGEVRERLTKGAVGYPEGERIAHKVYAALASNEVAKVDAVARYDRDGDLGFCFGRAAMAHYLLLREGVPPERIAKIFAIGRLRHGDRLWEFHMATLVMGPKGRWWVVDSLFDRLLPHGEWMDRTAGLDINPSLPQLRFYVTDPRKFQPGYGGYEEAHFRIPELNRYFTDLFASLKKK